MAQPVLEFLLSLSLLWLLPLLASIATAVGLMNFSSALTSISTPVLLYSHPSRQLAILFWNIVSPWELEHAAALGLMMTAIIGMIIIGRKFGLQLSVSD